MRPTPSAAAARRATARAAARAARRARARAPPPPGAARLEEVVVRRALVGVLLPGLLLRPCGPGGTGCGWTVLSDKEDEVHTFFSRDAGLTWSMARAGSHIYEYGDHGAIILIADDAQ